MCKRVAWHEHPDGSRKPAWTTEQWKELMSTVALVCSVCPAFTPSPPECDFLFQTSGQESKGDVSEKSRGPSRRSKQSPGDSLTKARKQVCLIIFLLSPGCSSRSQHDVGDQAEEDDEEYSETTDEDEIEAITSQGAQRSPPCMRWHV